MLAPKIVVQQMTTRGVVQAVRRVYKPYEEAVTVSTSQQQQNGTNAAPSQESSSSKFVSGLTEMLPYRSVLNDGSVVAIDRALSEREIGGAHLLMNKAIANQIWLRHRVALSSEEFRRFFLDGNEALVMIPAVEPGKVIAAARVQPYHGAGVSGKVLTATVFVDPAYQDKGAWQIIDGIVRKAAKLKMPSKMVFCDRIVYILEYIKGV